MNWKDLPQPVMGQVNELMLQLKKHDVETHNHCVRVSHMSRFLAEAAQLSAYECFLAQMSGLLHDVGKMKIPLKVLNKPGKLTEEEYQLMKKHSEFSAELVEPFVQDDFFQEVQMNVLHHHERFDGKGYPFQLEGEEIPYISRLILVVDTVDAMTQTRAYRKGLAMPIVYKELEKFAGTQFDPELAMIFIDAHKKMASQAEKENRVIQMPFLKNVA